MTRAESERAERARWSGLSHARASGTGRARGKRTGLARVTGVGEGRTGPVGFLGRVSEGFGLGFGSSLFYSLS